MLILTRRLGEKLMIGDEIEFQILGIAGNQIRIGIEAPKSVNIVREEIAGKPLRDKSAEPITAAATGFETQSKRPLLGLRRRKKPMKQPFDIVG